MSTVVTYQRNIYMKPTRLIAIAGIALLVAAILWMQHRQSAHSMHISSGRGDTAEPSR